MKKKGLIIKIKNVILMHGFWMLALAVSLISVMIGASAVRAMALSSDCTSFAGQIEERMVVLSDGDSFGHIDRNSVRQADVGRRVIRARKEAERRVLEAEMHTLKKIRKADVRLQMARHEAERHAADIEKRAAKIRNGMERKASQVKTRSVDAPNGKDYGVTKVVKKLPVRMFHGLRASSAIEIVYTQGPFTGEAEVRGLVDAVNALSLSVENGILTAEYGAFQKQLSGHVVINVSAPEIDYIEMETAAALTVRGALSLDKPLRVKVSSASSVNFGEIIGSELCVDATSAANVYALIVDVGRLEVGASSAADVKIKGMNVGYVKASAVSASGITLSGRCNKADVTESSEGTVRRNGLIIEEMPISRGNKNGVWARPRQP